MSRVDKYCTQLAQFAGEAMGDTATEVRGGAGASAKEISDSLDVLISLVKSRTPAESSSWADSAFAPAEKVRSECWKQLSEGGGWPNVGWREAYAFALMGLALVHIQRHDSDSSENVTGLREAVQCLDLALIMSGAGSIDMVHLVLSEIEPEVAAAANEDANGGEAGGVEEDTKYIISRHLPPARAPSLSIQCAIPREKSLKFADFKKKYFKADKSVILEGAIEEWPAMSRWHDLRYLRRNFGHRTVPVELGKLQGGRKMQGWKEEALLLSDLIDRHLAASNQDCLELSSSQLLQQQDVAYLAQHALFDQLPRLQQDLNVPQYTECGGLEAINAWLGTAGTVTPLHHDSYDNLLTQVVGFKYVRLYEPKETKFLYVAKRGSGINAQGNISPVECENPDFEAYPLLKDATYTEAILGPGDMLFIPSKHWHYVRSLSPSFSVNFWF